MNFQNLTNFLENLKPGGASAIPTSRLNQNLTEDDLSDIEDPKNAPIASTKKRRSLIKQADVEKEDEIKEEKEDKIKLGKKDEIKEENEDEIKFGKKDEIKEEKEDEIKVGKKDEIKVKKEDEIKVKNQSVEVIVHQESEIVESKIEKKPFPTPRVNVQDKSASKVPANDDERIKKLWEDLGIGVDGYLTKYELGRLCSRLGMNQLDKDDLEKLFNTVDTDHDGKVTLTEFCSSWKDKGLSYSIDKKTKASTQQMKPKSTPNNFNLFTALDVYRKGYVEPSKLMEYWAQNGVGNSVEVLKYLNIDCSRQINLLDLSVVLDDELFLSELNVLVFTGLVTYKKELIFCKSLLEINKTMDRKEDRKDSNELDQEKSRYESYIHQLKQQLFELTEEFSQVQFENNDMKVKYTEMEDIISRQEEELDAVAELHRKMDLELKILRDSKTDQEDFYRQRSKLQEQLQNKPDAEVNDEIKTQISDMSVQLKDSNNRVNLLENELTNKSKELDQLKQYVNLLEEESRQYQKTAEKLSATMDSHFSDYNTRSKDQENQVKLRHKETESELKSLISELNKEKHELEILLLKHKDLSSKYQFENQELSLENHTFKEQIRKLQSKLEERVEIKSEPSIKEENHQQCNKRQRDLTEQLKNLEDQLEELQKKFRNLSKKFEETEMELDTLQHKHTLANRELTNKNTEIDHLNKKVSQVEEILQNTQNQLKNQTITNNENQWEEIKEDLKAEIRNKKIIIEKFQNANDRLSKSLQNAIDKFDELNFNNLQNKDFVRENVRLSQQIIRLEDELNQMNKKLIEYQISEDLTNFKELHNLEKQLEKKDKRINYLENLPLKNLHANHKDDYHSFKKLDRLQFEHEELNKKYKIQLEQVDKTDTLLKEVYEENAKLLRSLQRSEDYRQESEMKVKKLEEQIKVLRRH